MGILYLCTGCLGIGFLSVAMAATAAASKAASNRLSNIVFQIGTFDRSSFGFASGTPSEPVNYVVGKNGEKDWYATQPAIQPSDAAPAKSNLAEAPRAITFALQQQPGTSYRLHIALLIESASVPHLRVGINTKHGMFYLHPKLDYSNGDQGDSFYPAFSYAEVVFDFPGSFLHRGRNRVTLQVVLDGGEAVPDAGLTYDAIELDRETEKIQPRKSTALLLPTIFYQQRQGGFDEIVNLYLRYAERPKPEGRVKLLVARNSYSQTIQSKGNFGEEKVEFFIPEFPAQTQAKIDWNITGKREHRDILLHPAKKWTLLLVPHIHVDIGYSDYQGKVASIQARALAEAMEMVAAHPDYRFSTDGSWNLAQFMKTYSPAQQQRLTSAIQKKQIYIPANYANLLTGFPTAETLIRSLYFSADFSRQHQTPFNYASITDVPSFSWSYASILAASGIHYLVSGSNNYRAPVLLQGRLNEGSPFWWEGPDGKKVLLWYSRIYQQMQMLFGLPPLLSAGHDTLPLFLQQYERPSYHANAVILYGTQVENTDLFPQQAELAQQWNGRYAYPKLEYFGFYDAMKNIEGQFGQNIPTVRGDGGPYWEDGIASDAYYAAIERQNESRGPSAEKLSTLTALVNPHLAGNKKDLDRMWTNMVLMDEHTWDSYNSINSPTSMEAVDQLAVKNAYAKNAQAEASFIVRNSMANLTDSIFVGKGNAIVFNTLNWKRSGLVTIDTDKGDEIVDRSSGQVVSAEIVGGDENFQRVQFIAKDVPAVGYKVYQLRRVQQQPAPPEPAVQTTTLESPYYRVELDPVTGAVRSIYDKQLRRELVSQSSPYRFGQYIYVTGGDTAPNQILYYSHVYPRPKLDVHASSGGHLLGVTQTPYGWVARMESSDTNTPKIDTQIRLFEHKKKIEFIEDVDKKDVDTKEAVYFAFPFAMRHPEFQYEVQTGVVNPAKDMYPGAGHEWFSVQHWVSVEQDGVAGTVIPLDVPLVTLGDINRGEWPAQFGNRPGNIFSYVMNNYWDTNYRAGQGGHFRFRYVVTSAATTDATALSRMGWEEATALEDNIVTSQDKAQNVARVLNGKQQSFLTVADPNLLLETWKSAEDGKGTILRFLDLGGADRTVTVHTPLLNLVKAWQTNAVERNQTALPLNGESGFQFAIHPHQIVTVRIIGKDANPAPKLEVAAASASQ